MVIAIVDDEREVREGLRYLIELHGDLRVAAVFGDAESFLAALPSLRRLDLVLMDIGLPGSDGISALTRAKAIRRDVRVLILTVFEDEERILSAIRAGADGYLLKSTRPELLVDQIREAGDGRAPLSPAVASRLIAEVRRGTPVAPRTDYGLSPREREILGDIAAGLTYRQIAENRAIAASTAKKHILHIYQKLNVTSKVEFVRKVIDEDLVDVPVRDQQ